MSGRGGVKKWVKRAESSRFQDSNWFARSKTVQYVGAEVHAVRPYDCSGFCIDLNQPKKPHVFEWQKYAPAAYDTPLEIDLLFRAIGEGEFQTIIPDVPNLCHSGEHADILFQRLDFFGRLRFVQPPPVPHQVLLMKGGPFEDH